MRPTVTSTSLGATMHDLPPSAFLRRSPSDPRHNYSALWAGLALVVSATCGFSLGRATQESSRPIAPAPVAIHFAMASPSPTEPSHPAMTAPASPTPSAPPAPAKQALSLSQGSGKARKADQGKPHTKVRAHTGRRNPCSKLKGFRARLCRTLFKR